MKLEEPLGSECSQRKEEILGWRPRHSHIRSEETKRDRQQKPGNHQSAGKQQYFGKAAAKTLRTTEGTPSHKNGSMGK